MKNWTSNLRRVLRLATGDTTPHFEISEQRRDGVLIVRPTQDLVGIGGRIAEQGILPNDVDPKEYELLFEVEPQDDPVWECRYLHIRCRSGRRFAPTDARLAVGWPVKNTDLVVIILQRALRELIEGARAARASADNAHSMADSPRRRR